MVYTDSGWSRYSLRCKQGSRLLIQAALIRVPVLLGAQIPQAIIQTAWGIFLRLWLAVVLHICIMVCVQIISAKNLFASQFVWKNHFGVVKFPQSARLHTQTALIRCTSERPERRNPLSDWPNRLGDFCVCDKNGTTWFYYGLRTNYIN